MDEQKQKDDGNVIIFITIVAMIIFNIYIFYISFGK